MNYRKYIVLGVLFVLPITVYLFFASGVNNFAKLPIVDPTIAGLEGFETLDGGPVSFNDHITVLGFYGGNVSGQKAGAFNLAHKIYKKNYQFEDFQFIMLTRNDQREEVQEVLSSLHQIADPVNFKFAFGSSASIKTIFESLDTTNVLDSLGATAYVYIVDKEGRLRGRTDQDEDQVDPGYDANDYAVINNEMNDDIKVILAEYRLALKKYKSARQR